MGRFAKLEHGIAPKTLVDETTKAELAQTTAPAEEKFDATYYIKLADQYFFYGEFSKALRYYSRALQLDNSLTYPWIGQIYSLLEMGQVKEASVWVLRALDLFPEDASIIALQALIFAYKGMMSRAIGASDFAMTKGSSVFTWLARGEILLMAENKMSHFCFEKSLEIAPRDDWQTPMRIGLIYYKHKQYSFALDYFKRAVQYNVSNYYLWYHIGRAYYHLGFNQKAIESLQRSLEHNPDFKAAKNALAKAATTPTFLRFFRRLLRRPH